jgi:hypothetical protein
VGDTFPSIVDTKLMSGSYPFREDIPNSALNELTRRMEDKPFEMPDVRPSEDGSGYEIGSDKYHEAGYDAFVTGENVQQGV